jgi:hypothetical protein
MPRGRPKKAKTPWVAYNPLWDAANMKSYIVETMPGRPRRYRHRLVSVPGYSDMTVAEIVAMETRVKRAKVIKENEEKDRLRSAITAMARQHGFDVEDILR